MRILSIVNLSLAPDLPSCFGATSLVVLTLIYS